MFLRENISDASRATQQSDGNAAWSGSGAVQDATSALIGPGFTDADFQPGDYYISSVLAQEVPCSWVLNGRWESAPLFAGAHQRSFYCAL